MASRIVNEYMPETVSHPGGTLEDALEERGMSQAELAKRTGRPKKAIHEIMKGRAALTPETAIQLERVLGIPASFWRNRQRRYDEYIATTAEETHLASQISWLKSLPVRALIHLGWIQEFRDKTAQLNEILKFFGVNSQEEWKAIWQKPQAAYRQSPAFERKPEANSAWLRKGEIESQKILCHPYDKAAFRAALHSILPLTKEPPETFEDEIIRLCAEAGAAVVFVPPLKGVPVYGATRWLTPEKALIQLTLRGKWEDHFWFSFFHEAGHILLHGKREIFVEAKCEEGEKEKEADLFARNTLIPLAEWERFTRRKQRFSKEMVLMFAEALNISPAIVVGRLQHEKRLPLTHMNGLRRKFDFAKN